MIDLTKLPRPYMLTALTMAAAMAGCGGGGGGGAPAAAASPEPVAVTVQGTAAKGKVSRARVTVYAGANPEPLGTSTSDAAGVYSVPVTVDPAMPLVVRITAEAGTTHLDEVTGAAQALPAGFSMRAVVQPPSASGTVKATVTPFSELAVAAAEKLPGGITADNAKKGTSTIAQMLGFDPTQVEVRGTGEGGTLPEQSMALLLTGVSQMANSGALGCAGDAGAKVRCVVGKLAEGASADRLNLSAGGTDIGAALATAVQQVIANPALAGKADASLVTSAIANLKCTGAACTPAAPSGSDPITAAKALFTELKSDLAAIFGTDVAGSGDAGAQLQSFRTSLDAVQAPAEMLAKDLGTLVMAVDLWNDFKAGRTTSPSRQRAEGLVETDPGITSFGAVCQIFTDGTFATLASNPGNANTMFCASNFYVAAANRTSYRHGFRITPAVTTGAFSYQVRAESRMNLSPFSTTAIAPAAGANPAFHTGSITSSTSTGSITAFSVSGSLPPAFRAGEKVVAAGSNAWSISGTRTLGGTDPSADSLSFSGTVDTKDAGGTTIGTLKVNSGSMASTSAGISSAGMDLAWTSSGAGFTGKLALGTPVKDKSASSQALTSLVLEGHLSNAGTDFFAGTLTLALNGYPSYNALLPDATTNFYTTTLGVQGTVSAPKRPVLLLTASTSMRSHESSPASASVQYRSLVGGTPRMAVSVASFHNAAGAQVLDIRESTANLSISVDKSRGEADLLSSNTRKIGVLKRSNGVVTFTDGTFMSTDLGL